MNKKIVPSLVFGMLFLFSACHGVTADQSSVQSEKNITSDSLISNLSDLFSQNDLDYEYDETQSAKITLDGDQAFSDSNAVVIVDQTITITEKGTYIVSGTLENGMIVVNAQDSDQVRIVLNGANITNRTSAAIYVQQADKVWITTAMDTNNTLGNGGEYIAIDENNIDAVIFSKSDLTLNGAGNLVVEATAGHGVVSKDDLVLTSGTYEIHSASHGLSGKDSVKIAGGTYAITSGKDGIHAENKDDTNLGFVYIASGTFTINAQGDGISSNTTLQIEDGSYTITTGAGSASVTMKSDSMDFGMQNSPFEQETQTQADDETSQKGIKANGTLTIVQGTFVMDTADDSIHCNQDLTISNGIFDLKSGDDTLHADAAVHLQNGTYTISYCYEGIEGGSVTIDDGTYNITANDDGINAGGGIDLSGMDSQNFGQDQFSEMSSCFVTINGGTYVIVTDGDCIDSNGSLEINGGTLNLTCNGHGNTALDCDGTYTNNGGEVTTNDGSENNPGQMNGGQGGPNGDMNPGQMGNPNSRENPDIMQGDLNV